MARVFSGIQPSGEIHLGNYIGAIRRFVEAQDVDEGIFCIVDLHALTVHPDPDTLRRNTIDLAATYLAAGIDPDRSILFAQSHVHEHAELAWIINCFATFGEFRRMTQFKEKSAQQKEGFVSVGLFDYPALMAADILLYRTDRVPVGDDQRQHLEITRDIAVRFNNRFGDVFVVPDADIPALGARIMDLVEPANKMSKSSESPAGTIRVTDDPDTIRRRIKSAVTDSGREVVMTPDKPALSNLLTIYSIAAGRTVDDLEATYAGKGYGEFKADLAEVVIAFLRPVRDRYVELAADAGEIARLLGAGAEKAQSIARETLAEVHGRVGLLSPPDRR